MVVLDAVHQIQATQANDLACRWNCKAGKCGSCSAEINGMPKLMCMTRLDQLSLDQPVTIEPMRAFPRIRDLTTDVSWNYRVKKKIKKFRPRPPDAADGTWRMAQTDIDRVQQFPRCIRFERGARAELRQGHPGAGHNAYEFLRDAMRWFEKAEELRPPRNDDALLHWNTCARIIMGNQLTPRLEERVELPLE